MGDDITLKVDRDQWRTDALEARAIIGDLHHDTGALAVRAQNNATAGVFSACLAFGGRLDAVVDSIDQQMTKRVPNQVDNLPIKLDIFSAHINSNIFFQSTGEIPDKLGEGRDSIEERDVGQGNGLILNVAD